MNEFKYDLDVSWEPQALRAGQTVRVTVKVNDLEGEISSMHLAVPEEGMYERLLREGDNVYTLTRHVPWEAYPGVYAVRFYALDAQGKKGPEKVISVRVA